MTDPTLLVTRLQRFSTKDGPGIRTTVFLQGCPLRCDWCHNPETQSLRPVLVFTPQDCVGCGACTSVCPTGARRTITEDGEARLDYGRRLCTSCGACAAACPTGACELSAKAMTVNEILGVLRRDAAFFGTGVGGVTLSGGEPLLQPEVLPLMEAIRAEGLSLAVETAGAVPPAHMEAAARLCDLVLYDLKDTDEARLYAMTGARLSHVLANLGVCDRAVRGRIRLRCILVRGVNTHPAHYAAVAATYHGLFHCEGVELIPYHAYAGSKAERIGRPDNGRVDRIPTKEDIAEAREILSGAGVPLIEE